MTFFLSEKVTGQLGLGSEVRIVLDGAPQFVIPAKVSYVASTAQFTPKTVETASNRQKLLFRFNAQIDPVQNPIRNESRHLGDRLAEPRQRDAKQD
jgi:hypothetical protein